MQKTSVNTVLVLIFLASAVGIASSLSVSVPAEAQSVCGLEDMGQEASSLAKEGQGEEIGEFVSGLAQEINLGQEDVSPGADRCRQNDQSEP
jgi:hypothetical protein